MNECPNTSNKVGDICDKCGKGVMRPTGRVVSAEGMTVGGSYRPMHRGNTIECDRCQHQHEVVAVFR